MAALTGNSVASSYTGLLKTTDNAPLGATEKNLTDGAGNPSTLSMGTASASFTGTLDVSGATLTGVDGLAPAGGTTGQVLEKIDGTDYNYQWATVEGLAPAGGTTGQMLEKIDGTDYNYQWATVEGLAPAGGTTGQILEKIDGTDYNYQWATPVGGSPGLVSGTGTDSMKSDASLTTNAAIAAGARSIALGDNARSNADDCIVIGNGLVDDAARVNTVVIGSHSSEDTKAAQYSTAVGSGAKAVGANAISLGFEANASNNYTISISATTGKAFSNAESTWIGNGSSTSFWFGSKGNQIGWDTAGIGTNSNAFGRGSQARGSWSTALAYNANASGEQSTAVSYGTVASAQGTFAAADRAQATASRAIAIGGQSTSALADAAVIGPGLTALWAAGTTVNQLALANYASLNYADDAAAAAGSVPLGGVYHTSGALKVRIV